MEEWVAMDARLENKKRAKWRRQQRELKQHKKKLEAMERERHKMEQRCLEMAYEDQLAHAMRKLDHREAQRRQSEQQREAEMQILDQVSTVRRRATALGLSVNTPGLAGLQRLQALDERIQQREKSLRAAAEARERLEALPKKRARVRDLMQRHCSSNLLRKVETAVYEQDCDQLVRLLAPGVVSKRKPAPPALLNHESRNGMTPVLCAIFRKKLPVLRQLMEFGASPNHETSSGMTPLLAAVMADDLVAIDILTEFDVALAQETSRQQATPLLLAADKARNHVLKVLLRGGVDVNSSNAHARTALIQSVISVQYETTQILIAFGADKDRKDRDGLTALDWARRLQLSHFVALLTANVSTGQLMAHIKQQEEEDASAVNALVRCQRALQKRATVMETALILRDVARIKELLALDDIAFGPNFEAASGDTPLLVLAREGRIADVQYALAHRCIPTHCNRRGESALVTASYRADREVIELLIHAGVSLWTRDFTGRDAMRYLNDWDHPDVVQQLTQKYGAHLVGLTSPLSFCLGDQAWHLRDHTRLNDGDNHTTRYVALANLTHDQPEAHEQGHSSEPVATLSGVEGDLTGSSGEDESRRHTCLDVGDDKLDIRISEAHTDSDFGDDDDEKGRARKWGIRQHTLKLDRARHARFTEEREKIRHYGLRGRRNGLIAPLPIEKEGAERRYPRCDNCSVRRARKRCFACEQVLCDKCQSRLHELPHRRHHEYEELMPNAIAHKHSSTEVTANEHGSDLVASLERSKSCVVKMQQLLMMSPTPIHPGEFVIPAATVTTDPEIERYERKLRAQREKAIAQTPIDVPVAAATHAQQCGNSQIYTDPAALRLADLYISQNKLDQARTILQDTRLVMLQSLGFSHVSMLKVDSRLARVSLRNGEFDHCRTSMEEVLGLFESQLPPDHPDLISAHELVLDAMDGAAQYQDAIHLCERIQRLRFTALSLAHALVREMDVRKDAFVGKRESVAMLQEDALLLDSDARNAARQERERQERERLVQDFRSLVLGEDEHPDAFQDFLAFTKREFADDMLRFWIAVELAKQVNDAEPREFRASVVTIYLTYIKSRRLKLITAVQRKKMKKLITTAGKPVPRTIFDDAHALVFDVLFTRVYRRFLAETKATTHDSSVR